MIRSSFILLSIFTVLLLPGFIHNAHAREGLSVDAKIGTLGAGAELSASIIPNIRLRGGLNYLLWDFESTISDINYDFETEFNSISVILDIHPFGGAFFLSGGFLFNNNVVGVDGTVDPHAITGQYESYRSLVEQVSISGDVEFLDLAPYAGLGWRSNNDESGWGVALELGVLYQGSPDVTNLRLNAPIDLNDNEDVQRFLANQESKIEDELSWFEFYPVASLVLSYHF